MLGRAERKSRARKIIIKRGRRRRPNNYNEVRILLRTFTNREMVDFLSGTYAILHISLTSPWVMRSNKTNGQKHAF